MAKLSMMLTVLLTVLGALGGAHLVVWWRLVHVPAWPAPWGFVATLGLLLGGCAVPLALAAGRRLPAEVSHLPLLVGYGWLGVFFYLFLATVATWAVFGCLSLLQPDWLSTWTPSALARLAAGLAAAVAVTASAAAVVTVRQGPVVEAVEVPLRRLPAAFDGLRVVQISDLHVASLLKRPYVEKVVDLALAQKPDLIVLTGDLVDGEVDQLASDIAPLAQLRAPLGTYVITGNHEYYSGADAWLQHYATLGMVPLRNARTALRRGGASIDLAGIDDWTAHHFGHGHGADLNKALAGRESNDCLLLLAHQPRAAAEAQAAGVDLLLSGHTHGGQLWPFGLLVRTVQPFLRGLTGWKGMQIYVNRGTGYWGPPMRLGASAELTLLVLRSRPALGDGVAAAGAGSVTEGA